VYDCCHRVTVAVTPSHNTIPPKLPCVAVFHPNMRSDRPRKDWVLAKPAVIHESCRPKESGTVVPTRDPEAPKQRTIDSNSVIEAN
jgi:hypothetical protein